MKYRVYVSNSADNFMSTFTMNSDSGRMTSTGALDVGGPPGAVATNRPGTRLYLAFWRRPQFLSFAIDPSTGDLDLMNRIEVPAESCYIQTDNTDRYLLSAHYRGGMVAVHATHEDGSLKQGSVCQIHTHEHAHSIQTDRSNQFAFLPHTIPANTILQFQFNQKTGQLSSSEPERVSPSTPEGPRHYCFHPGLDVLYCVNENGSTVSAYHLHPDAGTLSEYQMLSTLPANSAVQNVCAEIKITADGKYLYVSNRGHDSLAIFSVDATSGKLAAQGHQATEKTPRMFEIDPTDQYLCAAGLGSGRLITYKVDHATGELALVETHPTGRDPLWVQFVRING